MWGICPYDILTLDSTSLYGYHSQIQNVPLFKTNTHLLRDCPYVSKSFPKYNINPLGPTSQGWRSTIKRCITRSQYNNFTIQLWKLRFTCTHTWNTETVNGECRTINRFIAKVKARSGYKNNRSNNCKNKKLKKYFLYTGGKYCNLCFTNHLHEN